ncbi:class I SAM-dependent methyltransferase [Spirochaetota bacterium]
MKERPVFAFDHEPSFAELWDRYLCVVQYPGTSFDGKGSDEGFVSDLAKLCALKKITSSSKILDTCCGTGFPALHLRKCGFDVDCMDASDDMIAVFKKNALDLNVSDSAIKCNWEHMHDHLKTSSYDMLLCRGNSFIYAPGGWNSPLAIDRDQAMKVYQETFKIFYSMLKPGGYAYIDKFVDNEKPKHETIARVKVGNGAEREMKISLEIKSASKQRRAELCVDDGGDGECYTSTSCNVSAAEMEQLIMEAGFTILERPVLESEKHWDIFFAEK